MRRPQERALLWLALVWLLARPPLWWLAPGADYDMQSYARVASALAEGRGLYSDPALAGRYPYLPAWGLLVAGLAALARLLHAAPAFFFKLPALAGDGAVTLLLYKISGRLVPARPATEEAFWKTRPFWIALAWAANPLALMIGAGHGQFDSLALAFVLLAAWYTEFSEDPRSDLASALSLGFAIAFKTWPLFFLPLFLKGLSSATERRRYAVAALALPLLLLLPFAMSEPLAPLFKALAYTGSQAFSLPEALRGFFFGAGASPASYIFVAGLWRGMAVAALGLCWITYGLGPWRFPLFAGLAFATLSMYVFAPGLAAQYMLWLLPFALLLPGKLALRHSFVGFVALISFYALFAPETFLPAAAWAAPALPAWFFLLWAVLNLGLWLYFVREWTALWRLCRRPSGRLGFI